MNSIFKGSTQPCPCDKIYFYFFIQAYHFTFTTNKHHCIYIIQMVVGYKWWKEGLSCQSQSNHCDYLGWGFHVNTSQLAPVFLSCPEKTKCSCSWHDLWALYEELLHGYNATCTMQLSFEMLSLLLKKVSTRAPIYRMARSVKLLIEQWWNRIGQTSFFSTCIVSS